MAVRILIVDDSALMREMIASILADEAECEVVGTAADAYEAREKIKSLQPDVLTLDVEMPRMNGIAFLDRIMRLRPMPVVMISSMTQAGADVTLLALQLGAVDFVAKPRKETPDSMALFAQDVRDKVRAAGAVNRSVLIDRPLAVETPVDHEISATSETDAGSRGSEGSLIAIGSSTGGVDALSAVLAHAKASMPPMVIVQHMPAGFTARLAKRLQDKFGLDVEEASDGEVLRQGQIRIAPGDFHLEVAAFKGGYVCRVSKGDFVNRHRPSVDVLMRSVAQAAAGKGVGVLLTGMGKDGAMGLKGILEAGGHTIAQDEATSLVFGMPRSAIDMGAAREVLPLHAIGGTLAAGWA